MIAKGLDFPDVTLVGVVNADLGLHLPDFRASERTFQLITQVAGRSGRGPRGGCVVVQTFTPDHPALTAAATHDFRKFVAFELPHRAELGYPPFSHMIRIIVRSPKKVAAETFIDAIAEQIRLQMDEEKTPGRVAGPAPAPFPKLRGMHRFHVQVHSPDADALRNTVRETIHSLALPEETYCAVDVDPLDML
jgi:primosomal protein N' (replication factor Y)